MNNLNKCYSITGTELITCVKSVASKTQDFAAEQTPLFVREYVQWTFWQNVIIAIATGVIIVILLSVAVFLGRRAKWGEVSRWILNTLYRSGDCIVYIGFCGN